MLVTGLLPSWMLPAFSSGDPMLWQIRSWKNIFLHSAFSKGGLCISYFGACDTWENMAIIIYHLSWLVNCKKRYNNYYNCQKRENEHMFYAVESLKENVLHSNCWIKLSKPMKKSHRGHCHLSFVYKFGSWKFRNFSVIVFMQFLMEGAGDGREG